MLLDEYQSLAAQSAVYPPQSGLTYTALGLSEEVGEIAGQLKRIIRDDNNQFTEERLEKLVAECGDALWYLSQLVRELGYSLSEVASLNIAKLRDRQARNTLKGKGDNR